MLPLLYCNCVAPIHKFICHVSGEENLADPAKLGPSAHPGNITNPQEEAVQHSSRAHRL